MIRYIALYSLVAALGFCLVEPAFAYQSGVVCNPLRTDADKINYGQFGVHNESTNASARVFCSDTGISGVPNNLYQYLIVTAYDRDSTPNSDVCCTAMLQRLDGNTYSTATKCSNQFSFNAQTLPIPLAQTYGSITMFCDIPPRHPTNGFSHVTTFVPQLYSQPLP